MQQPRIAPGLLVLATLCLPTAIAPRASGEPLQVSVRPVGPSEAQLGAVRASLPNDPALRRYLEGASWRLLSFELVDRDLPPQAQGKGKGLDRLDQYRATYYDYTHNRALQAEGPLNPGIGARVRVLSTQPNTNQEEFQAAVLIVSQDPVLGPAIARGAYLPYPPMPPVVERDGTERTVNVGLLATEGGLEGVIVGVNMIRGTLVRDASRAAPLTSVAAAVAAACGLPNAGQATTPRGTAGQYAVTIARSGTTIWSFTVMRPSISTGSMASGIELRDVQYRGKSVLYQAHAPVLNVKYLNDACGPYRDWQWQESQFVADGTDVAPGVRNATSPPQTIFDDGTDTGSFAGVAYYVGTSDVLFTSELEAGWYRYIPSWRFLDNGTIQPRMSFAAVANGCVCNIHTHHAYWRLDFDIETSGGNTVSTQKKKGWQVQTSETSGKRNNRFGNDLLVQNASSGHGYRVVPGPYDGVADTFGVADYWLLKWNSGQLDDGNTCVSCGNNAQIQIGSFVNGESIQGQDVVVWYGAQFVHDINDTSTTNEMIGPDLVVSSW